MHYKTSLLSQNEPYFSIKSVVNQLTLLTAGNQKMIVDKSAKLVSQFFTISLTAP